MAMFTDTPLKYLEMFLSEEDLIRVCRFPSGMKNRRRRFGDIVDPALFKDITMAINNCILNHWEYRLLVNPVRPNWLVEVPTKDGHTGWLYE